MLSRLIVVIILQYIKTSNDIYLKLIECCVSIILQLKKERDFAMGNTNQYIKS